MGALLPVRSCSMSDYTKEFLAMSKAYEASGGDPAFLSDGRIAGLMVSHRKILRSNDAPGVHIEGEETPTGVKAKITVDPGVNVEHPVHLCFGVLPKEGTQEILSEFLVGEGAKASFLAHCVFPNAVKVRHVMDARIHVGKHAASRVFGNALPRRRRRSGGVAHGEDHHRRGRDIPKFVQTRPGSGR